MITASPKELRGVGIALVVFSIACFTGGLVADATIESKPNLFQLIGILGWPYCPFAAIIGVFFIWMGRTYR
jgi:hypothetical protein